MSGHGFAHDKVIIWKYPSLTKVAELEGKFEIVICVVTLLSVKCYNHTKLWIYTLNSRLFPPIISGHEDRVLNLALSPDGSTMASVAADETIRLWKSFEKDAIKKPKPTNSIIQQHIR